MFKEFSLGRLFGVEIRMHGTTVGLLGLVLVGSLLAAGVAQAAAIGLFIACILASVTLHELGHILAARGFGIGTTGVTLYPFGGLARLTRESRTPTEEVVVALAGPAVNVALAGLAAIPLALFGPLPLLSELLLVNAVLAAFNLIPAFPMDGGRVLRGVLWPRLGQHRATWYAARAGQAFSVLFAAVGLFASPMLVVIAVFVFLQASAELVRLRLTAAGGPLAGLAEVLDPGLFRHTQAAPPAPRREPHPFFADPWAELRARRAPGRGPAPGPRGGAEEATRWPGGAAAPHPRVRVVIREATWRV